MARRNVSSGEKKPVGDRIPPYSEEAERGVLGSIMLDCDRVMDLCISSQLVAESFYVPSHRTLYEAMRKMHAANKVIDVVTVADYLSMDGSLDKIGGSVFLDGLIDSTPTAAHAEYYIKIVYDKHVLRCIIDCARDAEQKCYDPDVDAAAILDTTEQSFMDITERQHGDLVLWQDAIKTAMGHVEQISAGSSVHAGISTGLRNLDNIVLGLRKGEMIVLAARPSMGKTSLAMNICENIALGRRPVEKACPVGVFSLEMSQEALIMRMLCSHAEVRSDRLLRGYFSDAIHKKLINAASALSKAEIYVDDTGGLDIMELRARARRMKKKYHIELIMIDYLQLLHYRDYSNQGRQLEIAAISGHIKAMAKELNIPVLVLSQLSRAPEQRSGGDAGKPKLSDLRDSGAIEQDADVVWLLRRPCVYLSDDDPDIDRTLAIVDVAKQRNGRVGEVKLNFEESFTRFRDRALGVDGPEIAAEGVTADEEVDVY